MAQRLRGIQRGASLLLHHAESAAGTSNLLPACGSADSLLQRLSSEQRHQQGGGSWSHHGSIRYASWWSRVRGTSTPPSAGDAASPSAAAAPVPEEPAPAPAPEPEPVPSGPPEYFPLPEGDSTEIASVLDQAFTALDSASISAAKAEAFFTSQMCISGLQSVHDYLGTPWWVSILIFNISLRTMTFPLMVMAQRGSAKMMEFNYHLLHAKKLQEAAMKAPSQEEHNRLFQAFRTEYTAQTAKHGDPMKNALLVPGAMLFNGAVFISIFNAISKLMAAKPPSLTHGGTAWFTDLTVSDPYFGLPIMCTIVTLAMVEYGINLTGDAGPMPAERQNMQKGLKWFLRAMAVMFLPAGNYVAAGTALLWVSNTAFGVGQGLLLRNDAFRSRWGLPTMQALRDMNARVMEANAASAPAAPVAPKSIFSAAAADAQPAAAAPLLSNNPLGSRRR